MRPSRRPAWGRNRVTSLRPSRVKHKVEEVIDAHADQHDGGDAMQQMPHVLAQAEHARRTRNPGNFNAKPVSTSRMKLVSRAACCQRKRSGMRITKSMLQLCAAQSTLARQMMKLCSNMPPMTMKIMLR